MTSEQRVARAHRFNSAVELIRASDIARVTARAGRATQADMRRLSRAEGVWDVVRSGWAVAA